jgi:hypothetical protein
VLAASGGNWIAGVTALVGLVGALLGTLRYFNYRSKRDRIAAVGSAFELVVEALASDNDITRLAAAIRLRRFFDRHSEVGTAGATYSAEALGVMAGVLRDLPTGNLQKLLADGLAFAPSLIRADLQRTNLQGAYLGGADVSHADFYRADLSRASLKRAIARRAAFYQARLVDTVLTGADLRDASFFQADLTRTNFSETLLAGAKFSQCFALPTEIAAHLDRDDRFVGTVEPFVGAAPTNARASVFVSRPSVLTFSQEGVWRQVSDTLNAAGIDAVTVSRTDYPPAGALAEIRRVMAECCGVVVLGFRQLEIATGRWREGTSEERSIDGTAQPTSWNHVEAGMASALGLPVFIVREPGVSGGVFDVQGDMIMTVCDISEALSRTSAKSELSTWLNDLRN